MTFLVIVVEIDDLFLLIVTTPTPLRLPADRLSSVLCKSSRKKLDFH